MKKVAIKGIVVAFLLGTGSGAVFGQVTSGNLAGTVRDSSGAVIANATILAVNEDTKVSYKGATNENGEATINNLPFGNYDVTASAAGFKSYALNGVRIDVNKTDTETFTLPVASATSAVEVTAEAGVALDTTSTNLTSNFQAREVEVLPSATVGLGVLNLSLLSANVASSGGIGAGTGPSVDGNRPRNNNFTIEGIDNNNKGVTGPLVFIPNDAVGEFSIIVGQFSPEFGHSSGGQFNTLVKSGTNNLHGTAYEYFQNRDLNATNIPAGQKQPKARYDFNRYGGQVGGPIKRDKLFFFADYERQTTGQNFQSYVCTPIASGITTLQSISGLNATNLAQYIKYTPVSPGTSAITAAADAACGISSTAPQNLLIFPGTSQSPAPYGAFSAQVYGSGTPTAIPMGNYLVSAPAFTNKRVLATSGDWTISPKDSFRLRYLYNATATQDTAAALPAFFNALPYKYHLVALSEYHTFTPSLTNELRIGFNRYATATPSGPFSYPGLDAFPNIKIVDDLGGLNYGPNPNAPQSTIQNLYQATDNILWTYKTHTFKIGFDGRKYISPQTFTQRVRGDYEWNYLTEYLHDLAPTSFGERSQGNTVYYGDQTALYGYANDTWRISPQVTLNYGLRYEFTSVPVGERAQVLNNAASVPGLINFTSPQPQYKSLAPRFGLSYSPDEKTQVRAGFSMAYDVLFDNLGLLSFPPQYSSTNDVGQGASPAVGSAGFLAGGGLPPGSGALKTFATVAAQRAATSAFLPNQILPYAETYTLSVQRVVASNYTAELRYTGSRGVHLPTQDQINVQPRVNTANQLSTSFGGSPVTGPTTIAGPAGQSNLAAINALSNIVPAYLAAGFTSKITSYQPYSQSSYNAGSFTLIRRLQNGLSFNAAYTFSKTLDDATAEVFSTVLTPRRQQNSQCISCDYSRSALDRTHRFSLAVVYDLPYFKHSNFLLKNLAGNWEVAPIYVYESPEYATVLSGVNSNLNGDSSTIDRTIINPGGVPGTSSSVKPVYSSTLVANCTPPATTCSGNLVGYAADVPNAYYIAAGSGTLPNGSRNTLPIRPIDDIDVTAVKRISFSERYAFEFQAQAFNVLNHPQYIPGSLNNVNVNSTSTTSTAFQTVGESNKFFNQPQLTFNSNARTMQLAAKLIF